MLKQVTRKISLERSKGNLHIFARDKVPHKNRVINWRLTFSSFASAQ